MGDVGGIPEEAYDDMITDENERRKLQGYNINKEMKINTTRMSRSIILPELLLKIYLAEAAPKELYKMCQYGLPIHHSDIGCLQEIGW